MTLPFFTIGHSSHSLDTFIGLLKDAGIELVADVRTVPRSRANPQYNGNTLAVDLIAQGIAYDQMAALGGLRSKQGVPPDTNALWENESFHNYADHALSDEFQAGFQHLRSQGHRHRCAVMCSEAVWWRCHRRIIADYLIAAGESVWHIMGHGRLEPGRLTPGAIVQSDAKVLYPARED